MSSTLTARIAEEARAISAPPRAAQRRRALEALAAGGLPSGRDENWKYANLRPLERLRFAPAQPAHAPAASELPAACAGFTRYTFIDGHFATALSNAAPQPFFATLGEADAASPVDLQPADLDQRFALLNSAFATDGALLRVGAQAGAAQVELLFIATAPAAQGASYPRVELRLESGAQLTLIERHLSHGAQDSFVTSSVQVDLARDARCTHYRLQELGARCIALDTLVAQLAGGAHYHLRAVHSGAQAARSTIGVRLAGDAAGVRLAVAALGERAQVQDTYAHIAHAAPGTRTEELFRGIAAGRSRVAFNGKILVTPQARGADSQQSLKGLLAGEEAEIDVRPQLEIYTQEVRCSHGATAGKLDENMLFYLLSRGLPREGALRLLKWAFLEDVIAGIEVAELRRQIEARLAQLLPDAPEELLS